MLLLRANNIKKSYHKNRVLKGISLTAESGKLIGIVGENGSGKSTLLKVLAGDIKADNGNVDVAGSIGYCPQRSIINKSLTIAEHIEFFKAAYQTKSMTYVDHLIDELRIHKYKNKQANTLSEGTLQKLNLILALMSQPSILLLDEPYQGFDWESYLKFWDLVEELKDDNRTIIVVSHLLFERNKFDHIWQLKSGRIEN